MVKSNKFLQWLPVALAPLLLLSPNIAKAIEVGVGIPDGKGGTTTSFTSYVVYIKTIFSFAMKLGAALAVLMILYAAIKYITSQGNTSATNEAKDIIIGSLSGFAMLLLIYLILNVIGLGGTPGL